MKQRNYPDFCKEWFKLTQKEYKKILKSSYIDDYDNSKNTNFSVYKFKSNIDIKNLRNIRQIKNIKYISNIHFYDYKYKEFCEEHTYKLVGFYRDELIGMIIKMNVECDTCDGCTSTNIKVFLDENLENHLL
jgi:hypothetical protein